MKILIGLAVLGALGWVVFTYGPRLRGGPTLSGPAAICAQDFPESPRDQVAKRCTCVVDALEKTDEGREVLKLVISNGHFLKSIESAASHASVLDAMSACGQ